MSTLAQAVQKPVNIVAGQNVNYTVPVGRIAKVKIVIAASNGGYSTATGVTIVTGASSSVAQSLELVLRAGDVLSSTRTTNSGNTAVLASSAQNRSVTASTAVLLNGVACCAVFAEAGLSTLAGASAGGNLTTAGTATIGFIAEEYLE